MAGARVLRQRRAVLATVLAHRAAVAAAAGAVLDLDRERGDAMRLA